MATREERFERGQPRIPRTRRDSKFIWREDEPSGGEPIEVGIFAELTQLPESVQRRLDRRGQERWMLAANRAYVAATGTDDSRRAEAVRVANAEVP